MHLDGSISTFVNELFVQIFEFVHPLGNNRTVFVQIHAEPTKNGIDSFP